MKPVIDDSGMPTASVLRLLYALRNPSHSFLYGLAADNACTRPSPYKGNSMSVMDGVSLLMGAGLFVYLLLALLRADRN